jgi:putative membrane protein
MIGTLRLPVDKISSSLTGSWIICLILALIGIAIVVLLEKDSSTWNNLKIGYNEETR